MPSWIWRRGIWRVLKISRIPLLNLLSQKQSVLIDYRVNPTSLSSVVQGMLPFMDRHLLSNFRVVLWANIVVDVTAMKASVKRQIILLCWRSIGTLLCWRHISLLYSWHYGIQELANQRGCSSFMHGLCCRQCETQNHIKDKEWNLIVYLFHMLLAYPSKKQAHASSNISITNMSFSFILLMNSCLPRLGIASTPLRELDSSS